MTTLEWANLILTVVAGVLTCIPLAIKLGQATKKAVEEKNWPDLMKFVMDRMAEAEGKFSTGPERKEWVMTCVKAAADRINYPINMDAVGEMIDALTTMSKAVNAAIDSDPGEAVELPETTTAA